MTRPTLSQINARIVDENLGLREEIAELEAELATLKAKIPGAWRLCGPCAHYEHEHGLCHLLDRFVAPDFACNRWTARVPLPREAVTPITVGKARAEEGSRNE